MRRRNIGVSSELSWIHLKKAYVANKKIRRWFNLFRWAAPVLWHIAWASSHSLRFAENVPESSWGSRDRWIRALILIVFRCYRESLACSENVDFLTYGKFAGPASAECLLLCRIAGLRAIGKMKEATACFAFIPAGGRSPSVTQVQEEEINLLTSILSDHGPKK